jgi:hypothetical protein
VTLPPDNFPEGAGNDVFGGLSAPAILLFVDAKDRFQCELVTVFSNHLPDPAVSQPRLRLVPRPTGSTRISRVVPLPARASVAGAGVMAPVSGGGTGGATSVAGGGGDGNAASMVSQALSCRVSESIS